LASAARFQAALWRLFQRPPFDPGAIADDAIVCRCEEVTAGTLRRLIAAGHNSPASLKRACRVGMGRCQGRYCAALVARLASDTVDEFGLFAPRPPAKPVPILALSVEQAEWSGHKDFVPPDMSRARDVEPLPAETVDTLVIGGGVAGSCLAYWLAHEGIETLVVERDDVNLQASGANAGSLHVQLLSFDFGDNAPPGGNRAADTLPLGPAAIALWQEIQRDTGEDLEIKITGGLMLAETERDVAFLKAKIGWRRAAASRPSFWAPTICVGSSRPSATSPSPPNGARARARSIRCSRPTPWSRAPRRWARGSGGQRRAGDRARRRGLSHHHQPRQICAKRIVNAAGPWAAEVAGLLGVALPVRGAPLQMIVTEATAPTLTCLVAHAARHLTLKQAASGAFLIGGGWTAGLDERQKLSRALRSSVEGNLWVASRVVPALAHLHVLRIWAGMNVNIDRAPILGEVPGLPGFYNCVSSNGYTLAPVLARLTAEMMSGRQTSLPVEPYSIRRSADGHK
jgi:glycine/D-amino acid oxidase-like deaminating enzyme/bacterioferritin-associated ferredoxin